MLAICALHNCLRTRTLARRVYSPPGSVDYHDPDTGTVVRGEWRKETDPCWTTLQRGRQNASTTHAREVRDTFTTYFNSADGAVEWQDRMVQFD